MATDTFLGNGTWVGSGSITFKCWGAGGHGNKTGNGGSGGAYAEFTTQSIEESVFHVHVGMATAQNGGVTFVSSSTGNIVASAPGGKQDGTIEHQFTDLSGSVTQFGGRGGANAVGYSNYNGSGGGGAGGGDGSSPGAGGISSVGGNGGDGAYYNSGPSSGIYPATDGIFPGGGGGGGYDYGVDTSANGANGKVEVINNVLPKYLLNISEDVGLITGEEDNGFVYGWLTGSIAITTLSVFEVLGDASGSFMRGQNVRLLGEIDLATSGTSSIDITDIILNKTPLADSAVVFVVSAGSGCNLYNLLTDVSASDETAQVITTTNVAMDTFFDRDFFNPYATPYAYNFSTGVQIDLYTTRSSVKFTSDVNTTQATFTLRGSYAQHPMYNPTLPTFKDVPSASYTITSPIPNKYSTPFNSDFVPITPDSAGWRYFVPGYGDAPLFRIDGVTYYLAKMCGEYDARSNTLYASTASLTTLWFDTAQTMDQDTNDITSVVVSANASTAFVVLNRIVLNGGEPSLYYVGNVSSVTGNCAAVRVVDVNNCLISAITEQFGSYEELYDCFIEVGGQSPTDLYKMNRTARGFRNVANNPFNGSSNVVIGDSFPHPITCNFSTGSL